MAFPADPVPLTAEFYIDGAWVEITEDVRGGGNVVRIERGRRDVQGAAQPTSCNFTLDNRDGTYTDENPTSVYYGLLPLYMPCRFRVSGEDSYLFTSSFYNPDYAYTVDKAALDITGDIDLRADIDPTAWQAAPRGLTNPDTTTVIPVMSKSASFLGDFSWFFGITHRGEIYFAWSPTGNIGDAKAALSQPLTGVSGRYGIRVTLDVNNGAGGYTANFYTAPTIDGPWTLQSSLVTAAGITSIHAGTGETQITASNDNEGFSGVARMFSGRVYAAQIYNSAGVKVADADFRTQDIDVTSFADGLGNTWILEGAAIIANDGVRFWGETQSLPQEWDETSIENVSRATAFDLLQRLSIDQAQLESPLRQTLLQYNPTLYMPGEDAIGATQLATVAPGSVVVQTENVAFQGDEGPDGSDGAWSATGADTYVRALARTEPHTGISNATWFCKIGTLPAPADGDVRFMYTYASVGSIRRWFVYVSAVGFKVEGYDGGGSLVTSSSSLFGAEVNPLAWMAMNLEVSIVLGVITWTFAYFNTDGEGSATYTIGTSTAAGMVGGNQDAMIIDAAEALTDISFAHTFITVDPEYDFISEAIAEAASGWSGEKAGDRFERLCRDNGIAYEIEGYADITVPMGRQRVTSLADSLQECADTEGGFLLGSRRQLGLLMITQKAVARSAAAVSLAHSASELAHPPRPVGDSYGRMNDVTVTRANGGGSSRRVITDGKYGTDRIGIVPGGTTVNVESDADTEPVAGFLAALGTVEAKRIENISVALNRPQTLLGSAKASALLAVDSGRHLEISDFPTHQSPDTSEQLVQGYVETMTNMSWEIVFTGTPYGPWSNENFDPLVGDDIRFAASATTVGTAMNTTIGTLMLDTSGGDPLWATVALVPTMTFNFDIMVGGERMTITNITGGASPQTATVTRSVNGIVKSHAAGTAVQLANVPYLGR